MAEESPRIRASSAALMFPVDEYASKLLQRQLSFFDGGSTTAGLERRWCGSSV